MSFGCVFKVHSMWGFLKIISTPILGILVKLPISKAFNHKTISHIHVRRNVINLLGINLNVFG
ncbi:hypothetical protein ACE6H2_026754 [Prunus campanulata]